MKDITFTKSKNGSLKIYHNDRHIGTIVKKESTGFNYSYNESYNYLPKYKFFPKYPMRSKKAVFRCTEETAKKRAIKEIEIWLTSVADLICIEEKLTLV